jgi:hypothetical protein
MRKCGVCKASNPKPNPKSNPTTPKLNLGLNLMYLGSAEIVKAMLLSDRCIKLVRMCDVSKCVGASDP